MPVSIARYAFWLSVLMGIVSCRPVAERPPNIIVVSIDTLNRGALRAFDAALRGEPFPGDARPLYAMEHNYTWSEEGVRRVIEGPGDQPSAVAVIEGRHWYIRGLWSDELYDMSTDGAQRRNLAPEAQDPDASRRLVPERSELKTAPNPIQPDAELALQLRSLGCAQ